MTLPLSSVLLQHRRRRENSQPKIDSFFSAGVYLASQLHTTINHLNKCSNISDTIWYLSLVAVQQRAAHIPQPLWGILSRSVYCSYNTGDLNASRQTRCCPDTTLDMLISCLANMLISSQLICR